jgi:hypothetical protein
MYVRNKTPKTTGVTIEDTKAENCLSKGNLLLQKGVWAHGQQAHGVDRRSALFSLMVHSLLTIA